jgi:hypothetical protein
MQRIWAVSVDAWQSCAIRPIASGVSNGTSLRAAAVAAVASGETL